MEAEKSLTNLETVLLTDGVFTSETTKKSDSGEEKESFSRKDQVSKSENELCEMNSETIIKVKGGYCGKCKECGKEFKTEFWLNKHMKSHILNRSFECDLCGKTFKRNSMLSAHCREVHSKTKTFSCAKCDYATNNKTNYESHFAVRHLDVNENGTKCEFCDKKFFRKEDMLRHNIKKHNAPRFKCNICEKSYTSNKYLLLHKVIHKPDFKLEHQCVQCGKLFPNGGRLSSHIRRTHSGLQYSCKECGKSMSTPTGLRDHMTQHSGDKHYQCDSCRKTFATPKYLRIHSRTHTGEKPYSCKECEKSFTQKSSLSVHIRRYHVEAKPFSCEMCYKMFVTSKLLKNHMKGHKSVIIENTSMC